MVSGFLCFYYVYFFEILSRKSISRHCDNYNDEIGVLPSHCDNDNDEIGVKIRVSGRGTHLLCSQQRLTGRGFKIAHNHHKSIPYPSKHINIENKKRHPEVSFKKLNYLLNSFNVDSLWSALSFFDFKSNFLTFF